MVDVTTEAATLLGLLSDDDRLRVVAALTLGARTPGEVAESAGLDIPRAGRALARLTSGGLVEQEKDGSERLPTAASERRPPRRP
jgi:DNA-binding transcriptional ArsR family regulator